MTNKVLYYVVQKERDINQEDHIKILSLIQELQGIGVSAFQEDQSAYMFYEKYPYRAKISFQETDNHLDAENQLSPAKRIEVECDRTDNFSANILRDVLQQFQYRVYNTELGCFLPKFSNIIDCTTFTNDFHEKALTFLAKYNLKPVFILSNTYCYYALSNIDGSVHIVNENLLNFLVNLGDSSPQTAELSYKVADSLRDFVSKYDAELIPLNFYGYFNKPFKIMNYSGFNIENPGRKVFIKPYILEYQDAKSDFYKIAGEDSSMLFMDKIRMGETLDQSILRILRSELKISDDYVGAVVLNNVEYDFDKENVLTPRLIVRIYIKKANMTPEQEAQKNRGWVSITNTDGK